MTTPALRDELTATAAAPLAPALPRKGFLRLSPINRRRLDNFRRNRRGYWSFWIFLVLFVLSLFAEFIANDRPIVASYKGEMLFPCSSNYPEEKFGGFLAETDYRDPVIPKEIDAHGWMIWPPIRFSYDTHNLDLPAGTADHRLGAPTPPTWLLTDAAVPHGVRDAAARHIQTCSRHRMELARHRRSGPRRRGAADLRLPHLGPVRPDAGGDFFGHRHRRGRGAGLFRRLARSDLPALHRDLVVAAASLPADHPLLDHHAELLRPAVHPAAVLLGGAGATWCARNSCARRNFEYVNAARALGLSQRARSSSSTCCRTPWWRR